MHISKFGHHPAPGESIRENALRILTFPNFLLRFYFACIERYKQDLERLWHTIRIYLRKLRVWKP